MGSIFTLIVVVLAILAIFDIIVGVANDAVNFLNSAIGAKIASRRIIFSVAAVGILIGVLTSSGMMEVARSGVFYPSQFSYQEIMILFLGMIIGDIILLDIFNSLGLPTSTTVSMVFGLLGAAVAVSLYSISNNADMSITTSNLSHYINSGKAMAIIAAILLSVVLAFIFGIAFMFISRLIFSFRYTSIFNKIGAFWCGISFTGIIYFALFKGLKSSGIVPEFLTDFIKNNTFYSLLVIWLGSSIILYLLQKIKVNILKITILAGTFSLALAFAGNDLVNFIGVPLAGYDSYLIATKAGSENIMMGALSQPVKADILILCAAGIIMVLTLFFNKKAMRVTETELSLSSQNEGNEHFGSSKLSRGLVRMALALNNMYDKVVPSRMKTMIESRFVQLPEDERGNVTYDLIRATVNLTAASILISIATSLKLPLSTTYVVFMVAMGSSLADRAWGRETAVYRITGVFTVISGWFITAFAAFTIALIISSILVWGGNIAIILVIIVCFVVIIRSHIIKGDDKKGRKQKEDRLSKIKNSNDIQYACTEEVIDTMEKVNKIYNRTLIAVFKENRKVLKEMLDQSRALMNEERNRKYDILHVLKRLRDDNINSGHFYVQVVDYLSEVTKALYHIVLPAYEHIENNHEGFSKAQVSDLMEINDDVEEIFKKIGQLLESKDFTDIDTVMVMRDNLFNKISDAIQRQLQRINDNNIKTPARATLLYLDLLSETKTMVLQSRNLIKSQKYFIVQEKN
jgi:Phosphate/sulphate permeases